MTSRKFSQNRKFAIKIKSSPSQREPEPIVISAESSSYRKSWTRTCFPFYIQKRNYSCCIQLLHFIFHFTFVKWFCF